MLTRRQALWAASLAVVGAGVGASGWLLLRRPARAGGIGGPFTQVDGVVTVYDHPFSKTDHEAISANIPVFGEVRGGKVQPAHADDVAGDKAVRVKSKS